MRKVYDCFQFYNELDLLELRLNELYDIIDYFVLIESEQTHQRQEKKLFYKENRERFSVFSDKIINITIKGNEFVNDSMANDRIQRNAIKRVINDINDNDIVIISDLDEIPKNGTLKKFLSYSDTVIPSVFEQYFLYYHLNTFLYMGGSNINYGTTIFEKKDIISDIEKARDGNTRNKYLNKIPDGGWHFSFLGDEKHVINKIRTYAHSEFNHLTDEEIVSSYNNLSDPLGRGDYYKLVKSDDLEFLPDYVKNNISKFKKYIKE